RIVSARSDRVRPLPVCPHRVRPSSRCRPEVRKEAVNAQLPTPAPGVLIGRSALLDDVCAEFDRRPAVVVITGEAGVGKSRLVRELLGRTTPPGAVTLIARCQESDGPS